MTFWDGSRQSRLIGALKVCVYSDIVMQNFFIPIHIEGVLIHELTHANQECRGFAIKSCLANLKAEMEAYYSEGSCGEGMEPNAAAVDCLFSALRSSCPNYCKPLEHWQIEAAISWFLHRSDQTNLCDFGPGRGVL